MRPRAPRFWLSPGHTSSPVPPVGPLKGSEPAPPPAQPQEEDLGVPGWAEPSGLSDTGTVPRSPGPRCAPAPQGALVHPVSSLSASPRLHRLKGADHAPSGPPSVWGESGWGEQCVVRRDDVSGLFVAQQGVSGSTPNANPLSANTAGDSAGNSLLGPRLRGLVLRRGLGAAPSSPAPPGGVPCLPAARRSLAGPRKAA